MAAVQSSFSVRGRVIDKVSRQAVVGAFVSPSSIDTLCASFRYVFFPHWSVAASGGWYHQLPPYTALGYQTPAGHLVNKREFDISDTALSFKISYLIPQ